MKIFKIALYKMAGAETKCEITDFSLCFIPFTLPL